MKPFSILVIFSDSLRKDLGGQAMPQLAKLMEEGVTFENCFAQGISTAPSMTANLTSTLPLDFGGHWYLYNDRPTVAEVFRAAGFQTAAIHSNPNVSRLRNFQRGFEHFDEELLPPRLQALLKLLPKKGIVLANYLVRLIRRDPYLTGDQINQKAKQWLEAMGDQPSFMWLQYMDTHGPYIPHKGFRYINKIRGELLWRKAAVTNPKAVSVREREELLRTYQDEVTYTDGALGRLVTWLRQSGRLERTIVVFTADHGDEFGEHGYYGHINSPYDELIRVPLVIRFPNQAWAGKRIEEMVRLLDLMPTLMDYVGIWPFSPITDVMQGQSLLPLLHGGSLAKPIDYVITEKYSRQGDKLQIGLRNANWKYIHDEWKGATELYDMKADPQEKINVIEQQPAVAAHFKMLVGQRLAQIDKSSRNIEAVTVTEDLAVKSRLEALGYMD